MSEEAYAARDNTYRKYKEGRLAADPTWTLQKEMASRKSAAAGVSIRRDTAREGGFVEPRVVCGSWLILAGSSHGWLGSGRLNGWRSLFLVTSTPL